MPIDDAPGMRKLPLTTAEELAGNQTGNMRKLCRNRCAAQTSARCRQQLWLALLDRWVRRFLTVMSEGAAQFCSRLVFVLGYGQVERLLHGPRRI